MSRLPAPETMLDLPDRVVAPLAGPVQTDPRSEEPLPARQPDPGLFDTGQDTAPAPALWRLYAGRLTNEIADRFVVVAIPVAIFLATGSIEQSGTAFAVEWAARLVAIAIAGAVVDAHGARRVHLLASALRVVLAVATVVALVGQGSLGFPLLAAIGALSGISYQHTYIALESLVGHLRRPDLVERAQSAFGVFDQIGLLAGPALAATALGAFGLTGVFVAVAVAAMVGLVFAPLDHGTAPAGPEDVERPDNATGRETAAGPAPSGPVAGSRRAGMRRTFRGFSSGVVEVARNPVLRLLVFLTMLSNLVVSVVMAVGPALVVGRFAQGEEVYGLLASGAGVAGIGVLVGGRLARRRLSARTIGFAAIAGTVATGVATGLAPGFAVFAAGYVLVLAFDGLVGVFIRTERVRLVPPAVLARAVSTIVLLNLSLIPVAGVLVGVFGGRMPPQQLVLVVSIGASIVAAPVLIRLRRLMRLSAS